MFGTCDRCGAVNVRVYLTDSNGDTGRCGVCIGTLSSVFRVVYSPTEMAYATINTGTVVWHNSSKRAQYALPGARTEVVSPQAFHGILAMHRVKWDAGIPA